MLLRLALIVASVALSLGCERAPTASIAYPDDTRIRYTGWFDTRTAQSPRFAWPGSQIAAQFTGTSVLARLGDTPIPDDIRETNWISVVVDEQPPRTFALAEGLHVYPLAQGLAPGTHRVVIWKRTEAEVGVISFHGLVLDPGASLLSLDQRAPRRIVFVGDSITAGYGNEGPDASCHWSAASENNYQSYGAIAARELHAEYVAMAWSGKGLTRNYRRDDRLTMPELYDRVIPTEANSPRIPRAAADVVVLNLGTNDLAQGLPDGAAFTQAYAGLAQALRERYSDALLVLALGPMMADDDPRVQARSLMRGWLQSVREARLAAGDARLDFIELWFDPAEGVGCDFHPNTKTHARLGRELAALLRARLGW